MIKEGSKVSWKWGRGRAKGTVVKSFTEPITKKIKGSSIKRKATSENPAYLIKQENGNEVLKLESQLEGR